MEKSKKITRIKEINGIYYPQVMFKLFWFIPTGWWRYCSDMRYDIVDGDYIDTVWYKTEERALEYVNSL